MTVETWSHCGDEIRHRAGGLERYVTTMTAEQKRPLAELVSRCNADYSFREMERRAAGRGQKISHSTLADYAADSVQKMPSREQLEALSAALDTGLDEVRSAALEQFWGYVPRELKGRKTSMVVAAVPADLTQEEEEDLAQMVHLWVEQRRRRNL